MGRKRLNRSMLLEFHAKVKEEEMCSTKVQHNIFDASIRFHRWSHKKFPRGFIRGFFVPVRAFRSIDHPNKCAVEARRQESSSNFRLLAFIDLQNYVAGT